MPISRIKTDGIQDDAITSAKIGDTNVAAADIASNSVTSAKIAADAVTSAKIDSTSTGMTLADLTVDTNTLKVDATNNRVGIGTASPSYTLHSSTSTGSDFAGFFHNGAGSGNGTALVAKGGANNSGAGTFIVQDYGGNEDFKVDGLGRVTMPNQPSFMARGHGGGAYNNSAATLTPTNVIDHNIGNCYNTSNGYFTAPVAGRYIYGYGLGIIYATASSGTMYPYIRKNGTTLHYQYNQWSSSSLADYQSISASIIVNLAAGDYLTVTISTNGNAQWYMDSSETYVYGMLLG